MRAGSHRWRGSPRTRSHSGRSGSCRTAWVPSAANRCSWPPRRLLAFDAELRRHDAFPPFFCVIGIFQPPRRVAARDHVHYACQGAGLIPNPTKTVHYDVITGFIPAVRELKHSAVTSRFQLKQCKFRRLEKGTPASHRASKLPSLGPVPTEFLWSARRGISEYFAQTGTGLLLAAKADCSPLTHRWHGRNRRNARSEQLESGRIRCYLTPAGIEGGHPLFN